MAPQRNDRPEVAGVTLAALAAVAFGTLAISAKFAYRAGADPLPLLATRFWLASLLLVAYHLVRRRSLLVERKILIRMTLGGGRIYGLEATLFFAALQRAPASIVGLVFYSYPLWTILLGLATRLERFRWSTMAALVLGSTGVALVFSLPTTSPAGPLLALAAAVAVAIYYIVIQVLLRDVSPSVAAMWTSAGAAVGLTIVSLVRGETLPLAALGPAFALAVASALAFALLYEAVNLIGSARSAIAAMLEPVTTVLLAAILLGEDLNARIIIGAALIVSVLPLLAGAGRNKAGPPAPDAL
jgi:drug/metabolite transporter (DMT)-like permease